MELNENIVQPDANGNCTCGGYTWSNCVGSDGACSKGCCEYEGSPEQWAAETGGMGKDRPMDDFAVAGESGACSPMVCSDTLTCTGLPNAKPYGCDCCAAAAAQGGKTLPKNFGDIPGNGGPMGRMGGIKHFTTNHRIHENSFGQFIQETSSLNEEMELCTCSDGSTYNSSNCDVTDPCLCNGNCDKPNDIATALGASPVKDDSKSMSKKRPPISPTDPTDKESGLNLQERFHQLAGIKPLYEMYEDEDMDEYGMTKEELLNEGPELWTALGGLVSIIGAAGITTQLQMMAEDPAIAEKYPKLEKVFSFLSKVGGSLAKGIK